MIRIADRLVGGENPCFVIAEIGVNHDGNIDRAKELIRAASDAGADAVKFQTFRTEDLVLKDTPRAQYQTLGTGGAGSQMDMLLSLELSADDHSILIEESEKLGLVMLSSPFDKPSADLLRSLGLVALKIASGELTNHQFLRHLSGMGIPLLLSTGMSTMVEVEEAMSVIRSAGSPPTVVLHCVSSYPAPVDEVNLRAMQVLRERFEVPVGFSDHTLGFEVALAAVALGASVLEKHLTLDKRAIGPDHAASLEPAEFAEMVRCIRVVESALGNGEKVVMPSERDTATVARKSLVSARDIPAGTVLSEEDISIRRPGTGLAPYRYQETVGRRARSAIEADSVLTEELLE